MNHFVAERKKSLLTMRRKVLAIGLNPVDWKGPYVLTQYQQP